MSIHLTLFVSTVQKCVLGLGAWRLFCVNNATLVPLHAVWANIWRDLSLSPSPFVQVSIYRVVTYTEEADLSDTITWGESEIRCQRE